MFTVINPDQNWIDDNEDADDFVFPYHKIINLLIIHIVSLILFCPSTVMAIVVCFQGLTERTKLLVRFQGQKTVGILGNAADFMSKIIIITFDPSFCQWSLSLWVKKINLSRNNNFFCCCSILLFSVNCSFKGTIVDLKCPFFKEN